MQKHRFFVSGSLDGDEITLTQSALLHQWREVLQFKVGERVILSDGKGIEREGIVMSLEKKKAQVVFKKSTIKHAEKEAPQIRLVILYCPLLKKDNFEWVLQKTTEVGVHAIVPIITSRTVKLGFTKSRYERIIKEASEQSGRSFVPELAEPITFDEALREAQTTNSLNVFFDFCNKQLTAVDYSLIKFDAKIGIFIGPEGGWSDLERNKATENKCLVRSLGPLTLRAETAAIVATYSVCHTYI